MSRRARCSGQDRHALRPRLGDLHLLEKVKRPDLLPQFGERAKNAPTFSHAVTLTTPRTDPVLPFVDVQRGNGDPVLYGQTFHLKNQHGVYLAPAVCALKVTNAGVLRGDHGPSGGVRRRRLFSEDGQDQSAGVVRHAPAPIRRPRSPTTPMSCWSSREPGPGARNVLGAWDDSAPATITTSIWRGQSQADLGGQQHRQPGPTAPLRREGPSSTTCTSAIGGLSQDNRIGMSQWVTTRKDGDYWTIEPARRAPDPRPAAAPRSGAARSRTQQSPTPTAQAMRPGEPEIGPSLGRVQVQRIARRAHGADRVAVHVAVQRLAQAADVDVDGAGLDIDVRAPDRRPAAARG